MDVFLDISELSNKAKIHLRLAKYGSKCITIIEGLDEDLDLKRISRAMKRSLNCASTVKNKTNDESEEIIQLQGDHRADVREWLIANEVLTAKEADERIIIHGG